jgi:hypothetical protein
VIPLVKPFVCTRTLVCRRSNIDERIRGKREQPAIDFAGESVAIIDRFGRSASLMARIWTDFRLQKKHHRAIVRKTYIFFLLRPV